MTSESPTQVKFDAANAPFSAEQQEWLQHLVQWAPQGENQGSSSTATTTPASGVTAHHDNGESIEVTLQLNNHFAIATLVEKDKT